PGTWLAVTSVSFDISVLEIFWTLARGFKVVLYGGEKRPSRASQPRKSRRPHAGIGFSLFYFASDEGEKGRDKYSLLLQGARFADRNGFEALWTPERHFHAFGGLYPNPSLAGAAIAAITETVKIRAGSCVLPLHSPIRIAEEWRWSIIFPTDGSASPSPPAGNLATSPWRLTTIRNATRSFAAESRPCAPSGEVRAAPSAVPRERSRSGLCRGRCSPSFLFG